MIDWTKEYPQIRDLSRLYGVDDFFVCAIRKQENGTPGGLMGEFGVPWIEAPSYDKQLRETCATLRGKLLSYSSNPFDIQKGPVNRRLIYSERFIRGFAAEWAPVGASNDPRNMNQDWPHGVLTFYRLFVTNGVVG